LDISYFFDTLDANIKFGRLLVTTQKRSEDDDELLVVVFYKCSEKKH
jgi:hypothetical protein